MNINTLFSEKLYFIASRIVEKAFQMGGYKMRIFKAHICNYVFPDGTKCLNDYTFSCNPQCPVCGGTCVMYEPPIETVGIAIISESQYTPKKEGVAFKNNVRIVLKKDIPIEIKQIQGNSGKILLIKDKIQILSSSGNPLLTVYPISDPKKIWLSGILYISFNASVNTFENDLAVGNENFTLTEEESRYINVINDTNKIKELKTLQDEESELLEKIFKNLVGGQDT